ncbi:MAG: UxaA family hydrolase, partial [Bacteroidetes bacterium]|nr:UxaA family hydrolase [Candidatus Cryptobacteroides excrementavium]
VTDGKAVAQTDDEFIDLVLSVASGTRVNNERSGYSEIAIFKTGVTL